MENKTQIKKVTNLNVNLELSTIKKLDKLLSTISDIDTTIDIMIDFFNESDAEITSENIIEFITQYNNNLDYDFYIELDSQEYRFISDIFLEDTFEVYCIELFDECYLPNIPENIKQYIDYGKFISDCEYNGYAHLFSSYDGRTHIETNKYNIFRTN